MHLLSSPKYFLKSIQRRSDPELQWEPLWAAFAQNYLWIQTKEYPLCFCTIFTHEMFYWRERYPVNKKSKTIACKLLERSTLFYILFLPALPLCLICPRFLLICVPCSAQILLTLTDRTGDLPMWMWWESMYLTHHISAKLSVLTAAWRKQLQQHILIVELWPRLLDNAGKSLRRKDSWWLRQLTVLLRLLVVRGTVNVCSVLCLCE